MHCSVTLSTSCFEGLSLERARRRITHFPFPWDRTLMPTNAPHGDPDEVMSEGDTLSRPGLLQRPPPCIPRTVFLSLPTVQPGSLWQSWSMKVQSLGLVPLEGVVFATWQSVDGSRSA